MKHFSLPKIYHKKTTYRAIKNNGDYDELDDFFERIGCRKHNSLLLTKVKDDPDSFILNYDGKLIFIEPGAMIVYDDVSELIETWPVKVFEDVFMKA